MTPASPPIRIMLIDDHAMFLWGLERLIDSAQPRMAVVARAHSVQEATAALDGVVADVAILDIELGQECGLDLIAPLVRAGSRVLVLTGARDPSVLHQALRLGARGVVGKVARAEHLLKAVEKIHAGELWADQALLGRLLADLAQPQATGRARAQPAGASGVLTPRELQIVEALVDGNGASNRQIAERLFISEHTLRKHMTSIFQKLGVGSRLALYAYALRHGLPGAGRTVGARHSLTA